MNVKDFEDVEIPDGDMLEGIFEAQRGLMRTYHDIEQKRGALVVDEKDWGTIQHRFTQWRIKDLAYRTIEELSEATNCLKSKPWKVSEVAVDETHYYEELADAIHFLIELLITSGMSASDVASMYHRKHAVNEFRQRSQY